MCLLDSPQSWVFSTSFWNLSGCRDFSRSYFQQLCLFDLGVAQSLGSARSLADDFKSSSLVRGNTLAVRAQVWLNLLPHLRPGVQLFVRFTCKQENQRDGLEEPSFFLHSPVTNTGFMGLGPTFLHNRLEL